MRSSGRSSDVAYAINASLRARLFASFVANSSGSTSVGSTVFTPDRRFQRPVSALSARARMIEIVRFTSLSRLSSTTCIRWARR